MEYKDISLEESQNETYLISKKFEEKIKILSKQYNIETT